MTDDQRLLLKINKALESLILGNISGAVEALNVPSVAGSVSCADEQKVNRDDSGAEKPVDLDLVSNNFNLVMEHLKEMQDFSKALSRGNLDSTPPHRRNYLSAHLKELHTQFLSLTWSMQQLSKGQIVSQLIYPGILFESYNGLIEKIASTSNQNVSSALEQSATWDWSVNSWRYHQILSALNNLRIMVIEVAADGRIVYANKPATDYLGNMKRMPSVSERNQADISVLAKHLSIFSSDEHTFPTFMEVYDEKQKSWFRITSDKVRFVSGDFGFLHMVDDINEWKNHEQQLNQKAINDPMTGVFNRRYGFSHLDKVLLSSFKNARSCAAFIDLDGLKAINDRYGHNDGDYAIKTLSEVMTASARENDVICRFGGDEFIIVFENCSVVTASKIIKRMQSNLKKINAANDKPFSIAFSYGIIQIDPAIDKSAQDIISRMDALMYENKSKKKKSLNNQGS